MQGGPVLALLPVLVELSSEGESSLLSRMSAFTMAAVCCDWEAGGRGSAAVWAAALRVCRRHHHWARQTAVTRQTDLLLFCSQAGKITSFGLNIQKILITFGTNQNSLIFTGGPS